MVLFLYRRHWRWRNSNCSSLSSGLLLTPMMIMQLFMRCTDLMSVPWRWNDIQYWTFFSPQIERERRRCLFSSESFWSDSFPARKGGNWGQQLTGCDSISATYKMSQMTDFKHMYSTLYSPPFSSLFTATVLKRSIQFTDLHHHHHHHPFIFLPMSETRWRLAQCRPECGSARIGGPSPPQFGRRLTGSSVLASWLDCWQCLCFW